MALGHPNEPKNGALATWLEHCFKPIHAKEERNDPAPTKSFL